MKKTELLAPCGNMDSLRAAVAGGCDAVYLGMTSFSARAFAGNFDREQLKEAVRYCHVRGVRVYVTMNTMLYETEIENAAKTVRFLYENDVDALLIQDFGLFHYVRTAFPDFDVHCSTQMHIHNLAGVRFMKEEGASRVVLARETPIELIEEACRAGIEIEVFAYGAICISYSGQCLMSAALKNRSANRGMCAQCCRLKYFPEDGGKFAEGDYILSPKDLNAINDVPRLIRAGVSSLKIEGRMKRPEYVYLVTRTFREAIDAFYEGRSYRCSPEREKELLLMFNRGFSRGHLFHDDVEARMSQYRPNHRGIRIGTVLSSRKGYVTVKLSGTLHQNDGLRILQDPQDIGLTAMQIRLKGKPAVSAGRGDVIVLSCPAGAHPKKGAPLQKTSDTDLLKKTDERIRTAHARTHVRISYEAAPGAPMHIVIRDDEGRSAEAYSSQNAEKAEKAPLSAEKIRSLLARTGDSPFEPVSIDGEAEDIFMPVSQINDTRRRAVEQLMKMRETRHERAGEKPYSFRLENRAEKLPRLIAELRNCSLEDSRVMTFSEDTVCPTVNQDLFEPRHHEAMLLASAGDLSGTHHHCIAGMTMNLANSYALAFVLSRKGIDGAVFSSECSEEQIHAALEAFVKRYGFVPQTYRLVYGRRVLMTVKDGFLRENIRGFRDLHHDEFRAARHDGVTEILETGPYSSVNGEAYGSFMILDDETRSIRAVIDEADAELAEREKTAE